MSREPQTATRSSFQRHRRRGSSIDSYYSGTSFYQLARTRSPPRSAFQPLPPSHILSDEQVNFSQSSLDHSSSYHSTASRYPDPYTTDPFLPLGELRRLRSNEQLVSPPNPQSFQPLAAATLSRSTRKSPPTLTLNPLDSNFNMPFSIVEKHHLETPQGRVPEVEPRTAMGPIAELFAESPSSQYSHTNLNTSGSDFASAHTSYMSPPIELCPATPMQDEPRGADPRSSIPESKRATSIAEKRATNLSDVTPALQFMFGIGIQVNEIESRRVSISQSPACNEVNGFLWDSQEHAIAYGGTEGPESVGQNELGSTRSQIHSDLDKTPTNELAQIPWPSVSPSTTSLQRKRPAPIYVGNQVQRSTVTQTEMAAVARSKEENLDLKADSPTSINTDARSRKLSEASQFSLSMFPATPTTPIHGDILWAGLNSAQSPNFSSNRQSLTAPLVGLVLPLSARSLQFPSSTQFPRSAPTTPTRRETIEVDQRPSTSYTRERTEFTSADSPAHRRARNRATSILGNRSSIVPPEPDHRSLEVTVTPPPQRIAVHEAPIGGHRRSNSSDSCSVYSQHPPQPRPQRKDSDSSSCYSNDDDDAASMTSSVAEAIQLAQQERRWSRQSRLAYMRDSMATGSGRQPSIESQDSSSSSSGSPTHSEDPTTPEDGVLYSDEEKMPTPVDGYGRRNALVPTVNIIPPARKPVPRLSTIIEPIPYHPPTPAPRIELRPLKPASSMYSLRSRAQSPGKIVISHPHLNGDRSLGAEVLPHGASRTTLTTDGGVGVHSLAHSKSMSALRPPSSGGRNVLEKKRKEPKPPFDKHGMPSEDQLKLASDMYVYDEFGDAVRFGDIFEGQKTAVCFIRHFWCPLCQDYMSSIVHLTEPSFIEKVGVKLVIIGNGSPSMIKSYREDIFHCPYEMYTDPSRQLYNTLGMHLRTTEGGAEEDKGSYVKHGTFTGTMMVLKNALKMPLANAGDIKQLGGEFILGPGLTCSFTSRMHTTRSHTPIRDLLEAAGVDTKPWATNLSFVNSKSDQARWTDVQNEDLDRLIRRGLQQATDSNCDTRFCALDDDVTGAGELDLGDFRRLLERIKGEVEDSAATPRAPTPRALSPAPPTPSTPKMTFELDPVPEFKAIHSAPANGPSYQIEIKGQKRVELDHLGAVLQSRNGSGTWEACRTRKQSSSRPGTANSRPGTANSRPGTARSTTSHEMTF